MLLALDILGTVPIKITGLSNVKTVWPTMAPCNDLQRKKKVGIKITILDTAANKVRGMRINIYIFIQFYILLIFYFFKFNN